MIFKTRGIVFRAVKFRESSLIVKIYTEKFGMQSYIVNGVRSAKSKTKAALLQLMSMLDMEVYHHENRNIHRIKEMQSDYVYSSMLFDPLKSSVGLFMMEVLNKCIHEEEKNENMFNFICAKLQSLDQEKNVPPDFLLRFLVELSEQLGFYPHGEFSSATSYFDLQEGKFVEEFAVHPFIISPPVSESLSMLLKKNGKEIPAEARRKLLEALLQYYQFHVPNFSSPKSLRVLNEVFHS
ncbi:MAG: DNA repair protein RecO [Chitinophagales bacterium]